jgi:hypothetical protein
MITLLREKKLDYLHKNLLEELKNYCNKILILKVDGVFKELLKSFLKLKTLLFFQNQL